MIIAIGMDVHKKTCSAYAVYAGKGEENEKHREFLNSFNKEFGKFPSTEEWMRRLAAFVLLHECHVLMENSTVTHDIYWMLTNLGIDATVAQANELHRITKSAKKTDRNDSVELAGYMRRRLRGEDEFAECYIPSTEWMTKRELCRGVSAEKRYLSETKKRIRAHLLLHGIKLKNDHSNITSGRALAELKNIKDPYLMMQIKFAEDAKKRADMGEKTIIQLFSEYPLFRQIYSVTGFGPITAAYLTSLIVNIERFPTSNKFTASFGVVPAKRDSADHHPRCPTTHRGDELAREMLMMCTLVHIQFEEDSVVTKMYHRLVKNGKAKREALVAASRKLLTVLYSVIKSGKPYTPDREKLMMARQVTEEETVN